MSGTINIANWNPTTSAVCDVYIVPSLNRNSKYTRSNQTKKKGLVRETKHIVHNRDCKSVYYLTVFTLPRVLMKTEREKTKKLQYKNKRKENRYIYVYNVCVHVRVCMCVSICVYACVLTSAINTITRRLLVRYFIIIYVNISEIFHL